MTLTWAFVVDSVPFTPEVIAGQTSLGGSESACLGLARALARSGQKVYVFATKMQEDAQGVDAHGVTWIPYEQFDTMNSFFEFDVLVSLRGVFVYSKRRKARLRVLWNQDLLDTAQFKQMVMSTAWALDKVVYVSEYHRAQWEDSLPELKPFGYVTRNGFDPAHVPNPKTVSKDPNRIIHISRPERGLDPLLKMWPALKAQYPAAELRLCRYSSMYDTGKGSWSEVCEDFDRKVQAVNAKVGGITYLGNLNKADLYKEIADAAVMWYPGVPGFAETSCIAAVEAQANGTPFVGSWKGALAETVPSGVLIPGNAFDKDYQAQSIAAVIALLEGCKANSVEYRRLQHDGRAHVQTYTYEVLAREWQTWAETTFRERYESQKLGVLRRLLHDDDHTAALRVAQEICNDVTSSVAATDEAVAAEQRCDLVIAGKDQSPDDYADRALSPKAELEAQHSRLRAVEEHFTASTNVLDVACGNGAYAIGIALMNPTVHVTAIDYAPRNIEVAKQTAEELGVADRITWHCQPVWDFETGTFSAWWREFALEYAGTFDGVWCGEFIEHVADCTGLVTGLEAMATHGAKVLFTCPLGPLTEYLERDTPLHRGHVHSFTQADLIAVFGKKQDAQFQFLTWGMDSPRGVECGNWLITYTASGAPTGERPYAQQIVTTRPKATLSIGILAYNVEHDIGRCLEALWPIADEIVVGNTGSEDHTEEILKFFPRVVRSVNLTPVNEHPDGFAGVRNELLSHCTGDWFMWVDADEVFKGAQALWQYLESGPYIGYAIHQHHLQLDAPNHFDRPIRLFKKSDAIQFYGCVHEQPQLGDANGDITPSLELFDVGLAHTGYLTLDVRRKKMLHRNLPLLELDQERFPDRLLGKVLVLRDYINLADLEQETYGVMTQRAYSFYVQAVKMFADYFQDPAHKFHDLARPFYEQALKVLGIGTEMEFSLAGKRGGLHQQRAKPFRYWVRSPDEMLAMVTHHANRAAEGMTPKPLRLDPVVPLRPGFPVPVPDIGQEAVSA